MAGRVDAMWNDLPLPASKAVRTFAAGVVVFLAGCDFKMERPNRIYELTDVGVVESVEEIPDGGLRVFLARGESIELGHDNYAVSLHGGGSPRPEDHLLVGTFGSTTGYVSLSAVEDVCYLFGEPAVDHGTHILFRNGLRLPKYQTFDPGRVDSGQFESYQTYFCINTAGEVVRYGP
jgi:hypothetical protein